MKTIYFCVGDRERNVCGYTWRLWWAETSFYAKARETSLGGLKLSLHGQDVRPGLTSRRPGFKVDLDRGALPKAEAAEGAIAIFDESLPMWFPGAPVPGTDATHVLRFRTAWDMFLPGVPSAPVPRNVKAGDFASLVPLPRPYCAVDVDVFVSKDRPYWPHEERARRDNACLGPLRSKTGEYLTALAAHRSVLTHRAPAGLLKGLKTSDAGDRVRGLGMQLDAEVGFLWVCERVLSRTDLIKAAQASWCLRSIEPWNRKLARRCMEVGGNSDAGASRWAT